jgi:phenylalanyl-tRNA synthetase alpha chain
MIDQQQLSQAKEAFLNSLNICANLDGVEMLKSEQLGKSGIVAGWFKELASLDIDGKKAFWPIISDYKLFIEEHIAEKVRVFKSENINGELQQEVVDSSVGLSNVYGHHNLIQKELARMYAIFTKYGFWVYDGQEIVNKHQNFYSVNIPPSHPATDIHDTLYVKQQDWNWENLLLRTHTSCMQQELISKLGPECRFVVPGKVYRAENMDATHDVAFWQVEWVCIRKWLTLAHFKHDLKALLSEIFEIDLDIRLRPGYFPFTEPSYEVDINCKNDPKLFELSKGRDRLEILGCGMIHHSVLRGAWVDPDQYAGYAFGMGLTRMIAIKYGIKDIRLLTNGDIRFVESFV